MDPGAGFTLLTIASRNFALSYTAVSIFENAKKKKKHSVTYMVYLLFGEEVGWREKKGRRKKTGGEKKKIKIAA